MNKFKFLVSNLKTYDFVVVIFFIFLTILNIVFRSRLEYWKLFIPLNVLIISFTFIISYLTANYNRRIWRIIHYWYVAPLILITFKELYFMIKPIRQQDFDELFIAIDRWIFGTDPTHFLHQYSFPLLTEILQIVYGSFYFLPIILGIALLRKNRYLALEFAIFSVVYGFFLSYIGYFALPGVGPRFTLHNFETINTDLPGLWLTNFLREIVNTGESIPTDTVNPAEFVQRDVFPSGHTMITLVVMYLSVKMKSRSKYFFLPVGTLLIIATVYLWYHYVIDLIGGMVFMIFSVWSGKHVFNWWKRFKNEEEFDYAKH